MKAEEMRRSNREAKRRSRAKRRIEEPGFREKEREQTQEWRSANWEKKLLQNARASAKARGMEYSLTLNDIAIPEECPYLHVPLTKTVGSGRMIQTNASLDRIDNSLGYVPGNVEVVSYMANMMKNSATREQLVAFAASVLQRFGRG